MLSITGYEDNAGILENVEKMIFLDSTKLKFLFLNEGKTKKY